MVAAFVSAVEEQGWQPAEPPSVPIEPGVAVTRYDHDDPSQALPVIRRIPP
jgi:hypothetical protein